MNTRFMFLQLIPILIKCFHVSNRMTFLEVFLSTPNESYLCSCKTTLSIVIHNHPYMLDVEHIEHKDATDFKNIFYRTLFFVLFFIYSFFNDFSKKCLVTALIRSMTCIGGLNQFSTKANLTLIQHLLEKKMKIKYVFTLST